MDKGWDAVVEAGSAAYWWRRGGAGWRRADVVKEADHAATRGRRGGVGWRATLAKEEEDCGRRATLAGNGGI